MAKAKPIFIPGTNISFASASAAAKKLGLRPSSISKVLNGKLKQTGGYTFGFEENRTIYVPQTGQTFSSPRAAARSLGIKPGRIYDVLEGKVHTKGTAKYDFVYADKTRLEPVSEQTPVTAPRTRKAKRKATKQENRTNQRKWKQEMREIERKKLETREKDRAVQAERRKQREAERDRRKRLRFSSATKAYQEAKQELSTFLERVNEKLKEYYDIHKYFIYYNHNAVDLLALQLHIGYTKEGYFDTSLSKFQVEDDPLKTVEEIEQSLTAAAAELSRLKQVLENATQKSKGSFWDTSIASGQRAKLALEFNLPQAQLDKYAYLIYDLFDIFERAHQYEELGSDLVYIKVRDAMQGEVPAEKIQKFLEELDKWMENAITMSSYDREESLNEVWSILSGYSGYGSEIWEDEGWMF